MAGLRTGRWASLEPLPLPRGLLRGAVARERVAVRGTASYEPNLCGDGPGHSAVRGEGTILDPAYVGSATET